MQYVYINNIAASKALLRWCRSEEVTASFERKVPGLRD